MNPRDMLNTDRPKESKISSLVAVLSVRRVTHKNIAPKDKIAKTSPLKKHLNLLDLYLPIKFLIKSHPFYALPNISTI